MTKAPNSKPESLEDRTFRFAQSCKQFIQELPKNLTNTEYSRQLARSSGSVAANYIEANESLSKKDFVMRCRICRKEVKESRMWLKLIDPNATQILMRSKLVMEATDLLKIFSSIITKSV